MSEPRRLIVAGTRELRYHVGSLGSGYALVRDAIDRWEKAHGAYDQIVSGCNGHVRFPTGGVLWGRLPRQVSDLHVIVGADLLGEWFARVRMVPVERYPAEWRFGPRGGPERNQQMVDVADGLVVVRYPDSRGSADVLQRARSKGIPIEDVVLDREPTREVRRG